MCLIVFAWQVVPGMPLVAAANRDEFYDRPTAPAGWWDDAPNVFAGRDLQSKGTWQGISREGRFAAVTNVRAPDEKRADARSRGALVADFLTGDLSPAAYVERLERQPDDYNGYNLLVGDGTTLIWYSNRAGEDPRNGQPLAPGIYGMSNGLLDAPWPKVVRTKASFASLLCQGAPDEAYFEMLTCTQQANDCRLPKTGIDLELERALSSVAIDLPNYGTRVSTLTRMCGPGQALLQERLVR